MDHFLYNPNFRWLRNLVVGLITAIVNYAGAIAQVSLGYSLAQSIDLVKSNDSVANLPACTETPVPETLSSETLLKATAIGYAILIAADVALIYLVTMFIKTDSDLIRDLLPDDDSAAEKARRLSRRQNDESPFRSAMFRLVPSQIIAMVGTWIGLLILNKDPSIAQRQTAIVSTTTGLISIGSVVGTGVYLARQFYKRTHINTSRTIASTQLTTVMPTVLATDIQVPVVTTQSAMQHPVGLQVTPTIAAAHHVGYCATPVGFMAQPPIHGATANPLPFNALRF